MVQTSDMSYLIGNNKQDGIFNIERPLLKLGTTPR